VIVLKKIWSFIKSYWYVPVLIIVALILRDKSGKVKEILEVASESHTKQINAITNAAIEKKKSKKIIEEEYVNAIKKIEENYKEKKKILSKKDKSFVKNVIKDWEDHPDQMAERISLKFGIHYVPKENSGVNDG